MNALRRFRFIACALALSGSLTSGQEAASPHPTVRELEFNEAGDLVVTATAPPGFHHAILEASAGGTILTWEPMIGGGMAGDRTAQLVFVLPEWDDFGLLRVRVGAETTIPEVPHTGAPHFAVSYDNHNGGNDNGDPGNNTGGNGGDGTGTEDNPAPATETEKVGHLLNRIAYGPSAEDYQTVVSMGIPAYIERNLNPPDEADPLVAEATAPLLMDTNPSEEMPLVQAGDSWRYFRGTQAPPAAWNRVDFDATGWEEGPTGIGYGDDDDATVLEDMRRSEFSDGYLSVFCRKTFVVDDPAALDRLRLRLYYDDGFVAYLNGVEVARENVEGAPPAYDQSATRAAGNIDQREATAEFRLSGANVLIQPGVNVLAIQVHNASYTSSDLSLIPVLYHAPPPAYPTIRNIEALQELVHVRGIYADNQLQAILGEFWENHFTTDYHKLVDYLSDLNAYEQLVVSGESEQSVRRKIEQEAAQLEFEEYEYFHDNALGNFGDLLLYSATSPAMLIYLDNVLNLANAPNENYAREILELYTFGADNGYNQTDIEQLSRCFTGWNIRKTFPDRVKVFPESARDPYLTPSLHVEEETVLLDLGPGWRYLKGLAEPAPADDGRPTTAWAGPDYDDRSWSEGESGIGYGDDDDATILDDMRGNYVSVYLRREFTIDPNLQYDDLVLQVQYDDGYVAYVNGVEIGRSRTMRDYGEPPAFDRTSRSHEARGEPDVIPLAPHTTLLRAAPLTNVLAIQLHNTSIDSSDLTIQPRILSRRYSEDSISESSFKGLWTFRFNAGEHDFGEKVLFAGSPHEMRIPGGREAGEGVFDALEVIDALVEHPSTSQFICIKLINRFVSDEISLETYHNGTAPAPLVELLEDAMDAWNSTQPAGHIATVMRAILDPQNQRSAFWRGIAYRSKVKSAVEYINSSVRALDAYVPPGRLPVANARMGMTIFERETPDGFPESGLGWMDTQSLLERMKFSQAMTAGQEDFDEASSADYLNRHGLESPEDLIDHFDFFFFQGHLSEEARSILLDYADTDDSGAARPFSTLGETARTRRLQQLMALLLSTPDFQLQ